jgi:serine/threonine-protein kinase
MIAEVLALHVASTATTCVSSPIAAALASAAGRQPAAGDTVGVWRLEREIGRGGMGSVFLAERSDGHFQQCAALKVLRCIPRRKTLERFARERQLLATLTHPNIARLLDGGATPQGEPYLVMEYVDGEDIEQHCRRHRLGVRPVLALFLTACGAVAFAHRQLVVHCDLKPSNLLIDREGRLVLLDFGIARLIDQAGPENAAGGQILLTTAAFTPRYASPEQLAHGPITTASDIYSLGLLLGELLAQAADHDRPGALRRRELNAIVLRATRHDPAERYLTVDALMSDVRRFLAHQPVRALGGGTAYRTRKLLVRRWPWAVVAAVFLLTVAGFTSRVVAESRRARAAEQAAQRERGPGASGPTKPSLPIALP